MYKMILIISLALASIPFAQAADLRSLENLERERARMLSLALSHDMESVQREQRLKAMLRTLVDLERMVLRDDRLLGVADPKVRRAFKHYELTFVSHASMEAQQQVVDFWLEQQGLSTDRILSAKAGLR